MGMGLLLQWGNVLKWMVMIAQLSEYPKKTTELDILKGWGLCYVSYISGKPLLF